MTGDQRDILWMIAILGLACSMAGLASDAVRLVTRVRRRRAVARDRAAAAARTEREETIRGIIRWGRGDRR